MVEVKKPWNSWFPCHLRENTQRTDIVPPSPGHIWPQTSLCVSIWPLGAACLMGSSACICKWPHAFIPRTNAVQYYSSKIISSSKCWKSSSVFFDRSHILHCILSQKQAPVVKALILKNFMSPNILLFFLGHFPDLDNFELGSEPS